MKDRYDVHRERLGGYLKDIPEPHQRKWPGSPHPRRVKVNIALHPGIGVHYYTWIEEEPNPIWNTAEQCWQRAWDDKAGKGREFKPPYSKFNNIAEARIWIFRILQDHFDDHMYEITGDIENIDGLRLLKCRRDFMYLREGD